MKTACRTDLKAEFASALEQYISQPGEALLQRAYELGRSALDSGLGIVEIAALHKEALETILEGRGISGESVEKVRAAGSFFLEALGPFEMTHRAYKETNAALLRLNERLEEEAKRIAHALHDEAGQFLACVHIAVDEIGRELPSPARERLLEVRKLLDQIEDGLRRISHELRPTILDDLGLMPALEFLAEGVSKRVGFPVSVAGPRNGRFPFSVETAIYRAVQEALNNVAKHAHATRVQVQVARKSGSISCSVKDNGKGFDPSMAMKRKGDRGLGLIGIRERLDALGGKLEIFSQLGKGTEMVITLPLEEQ